MVITRSGTDSNSQDPPHEPPEPTLAQLLQSIQVLTTSMNDKFDSLSNRVEALEIANNARNLNVEPNIDDVHRDIVPPRRQNVEAIIP